MLYKLLFSKNVVFIRFSFTLVPKRIRVQKDIFLLERVEKRLKAPLQEQYYN